MVVTEELEAWRDIYRNLDGRELFDTLLEETTNPYYRKAFETIYDRCGDQYEDRWQQFLHHVRQGKDSQIVSLLELHFHGFPEDDPSADVEKVLDDRVAGILGRAGVPADLRRKKWEDIEDRPDVKGFEKARAIAKLFGEEQVRNGLGICLIGKPGTGKTVLALLASRAIARSSEMTVMFATAPQYIENNKPGGPDRWVNRCFTADLLIVDDLGQERQTEYALSEWELLVSHRYNDGLATLWTSNLSKERLMEIYGGRIIDRIRDRCEVVELDGPSYRGAIL